MLFSDVMWVCPAAPNARLHRVHPAVRSKHGEGVLKSDEDEDELIAQAIARSLEEQ